LFDLAVAIADVEGSITADEFFRTMFGRWLRVHIAVATMLECLLVLHIWSGTYFGLRWL
jgi:Na+/proline symporter